MEDHATIRARCAEETRRPGKFEGAPLWAPYYWDATLDGGGDDCWYAGETPVEVFRVTPTDASLFDGLSVGRVVLVWEDDAGFVHAVQMTERAAEDRRAREETTAE